MPVCCNRFRVSASASTAHSAARSPSASPRTASATPSSPPNPSTANPGTVELRRLARQAERRHRLRRGHRRRLRPRGRQRIAGVPAVRPRPRPHPGDGQLRREHRRRQGHLGVVPAAAAHPGPAAGDRRRRRRDLVLRGGRLVQLRPVAQAAVGRAPARRHATRRSDEVQPIDIFTQKAWRNLRFPLASAPPEANVARIVADDPNLSTDQWFAFTPPRVPVLETAQQLLGSQTPVLMDIATAANFPCQRPFAEHLGVAELPGVPDPAELQADGGVVEPVAVGRGRRTVPVHPGAAAHRRRSRPICATTGTATGVRSSATSGSCPSADAPDAVIDQGSTRRVRLEPPRTDQGSAMSEAHVT